MSVSVTLRPRSTLLIPGHVTDRDLAETLSARPFQPSPDFSRVRI
jgi:hypothetical protein